MFYVRLHIWPEEAVLEILCGQHLGVPCYCATLQALFFYTALGGLTVGGGSGSVQNTIAVYCLSHSLSKHFVFGLNVFSSLTGGLELDSLYSSTG